MRKQALAILVAALLVLAGCSGGVTPNETGTNGAAPDTAASQAGTGTVNFYISDEQNAIDDFEHLNVTITKVGFHKVGEEDDESEEVETESNETEEPETNETEEPETNETEEPETNETEEPEVTETTTETPETETEENDEDGDGAGDDGSGNGDWTEYDVKTTTVDLTELQGKNASLIDEFDLENGTYNKVFIYVSDVNGTLKNGEQVPVKLPSEKMHVNKRFTIGNNETADFVFDITVVKRGHSGAYLIKPVVSESGTDVEIQEVGDEGEGDEEGENSETGEQDDETAAADESKDEHDSDGAEDDENRGQGQGSEDEATETPTPTPTPTSTS